MPVTMGNQRCRASIYGRMAEGRVSHVDCVAAVTGDGVSCVLASSPSQTQQSPACRIIVYGGPDHAEWQNLTR